MITDAPREFVDANVLVYAFDSSAGSKQRIAQRLLERLWLLRGVRIRDPFADAE